VHTVAPRRCEIPRNGVSPRSTPRFLLHAACVVRSPATIRSALRGSARMRLREIPFDSTRVAERRHSAGTALAHTQRTITARNTRVCIETRRMRHAAVLTRTAFVALARCHACASPCVGADHRLLRCTRVLLRESLATDTVPSQCGESLRECDRIPRYRSRARSEQQGWHPIIVSVHLRPFVDHYMTQVLSMVAMAVQVALPSVPRMSRRIRQLRMARGNTRSGEPLQREME
jgi:hypothetical protein